MPTPTLLSYLTLLLTALTLVAVVLLLRMRAGLSGAAARIVERLEDVEKAQERIERIVREELGRNREELAAAIRAQRQELTEEVRNLGDALARRVAESAVAEKAQLDTFATQLAAFAKDSGARQDVARTESAAAARQTREELLGALSRLTESNQTKLEALRATVEARLQALQQDNGRQLDLMRQTVDEKLQSTLERRLGESFRQVSERLEQVHKGLGEMQTLATGVGDLKKVLTNVKTRGTWGEVQLGALLEQVLNPDQFATNVAPKEGGEHVEFAIKLPGQGMDSATPVWLPIDAKFPIEDYQRLVDAQERADVAAVDAAGKQIERRVRDCAADIARKYLNPPRTTDFGILFLPIEGLFAEVIRRPGLAELVQREQRVVIAGPTTLWSILNSLQMGFRTLAIQKRSSEVWNLLAAVKTEWSKYGEMLDAVQKRIQQASETIDKVRVRSRAVGRKLKDVQELPAGEVSAVLPLSVEGAGRVDEDDDAAPAPEGVHPEAGSWPSPFAIGDR